MVAGVFRTGLKSEITQISCQNCKKSGGVKIQCQSEYFHMSLLPVMSIGKIVKSKCANCDQILNYVQMSESLKIEADRLKKESKTPLWQNTLALVLAIGLPLMVVTGLIIGNIKKSNQLSYIEAPQKNDLHIYRESNSNYYYKTIIHSVTRDSIYIRKDPIHYDRIPELDNENIDVIYDKSTYSISKDSLFEWFDNHLIVQVKR